MATLSITVTALDQMSNAFAQMEGKLRGFTRRVVNQMLNVSGIIAGALSARALLNFANQCAEAWKQQDQALAGLTAALGYASPALQQLASDLQRTTTFGDEATLAAMAQLGVFLKEEEQIKRLIPLVQDFAAAKRMDLVQAAELVSKTIGSSTNALSRYGVAVTGEVGSTERLNSLASQLSATYGGWAQNLAETDTGKLEQAKNLLGDAQEALGKAIIPLQIRWYRLMTVIVEMFNRLFGLNPASDKLSRQIATQEKILADFIRRKEIVESSRWHTERSIKAWDKRIAEQKQKIADMKSDLEEMQDPTTVNIPALPPPEPPTKTPQGKRTPRGSEVQSASTLEYLSSTYDTMEQAHEAWLEKYRAGIEEITAEEWIEKFGSFHEQLALRIKGVWSDFRAGLEGMFDQMWNTITDGSLTGSEKWSAIIDQMYGAAKDMLWSFIKEYISAKFTELTTARSVGASQRSENYKTAASEGVNMALAGGSGVASTKYVGWLLAAAAVTALLGTVSSAISQSKSYAIGTPSHPGGAAVLHPNEMVVLPRGSQVLSSGATQQELSQRSGARVENRISVVAQDRSVVDELRRVLRSGEGRLLLADLRAQL